MNALRLAILSGILLLLAACQPPEQTGRGMVLPEGNADNGQLAFTELGCIECHSVAGVELQPFEHKEPFPLQLGGKVFWVKNYGQLITAITNPQHAMAPRAVEYVTEEQWQRRESPMPKFNDRMTVEQMIDLITFLQPAYEKIHPRYRGH